VGNRSDEFTAKKSRHAVAGKKNQPGFGRIRNWGLDAERSAVLGRAGGEAAPGLSYDGGPTGRRQNDDAFLFILQRYLHGPEMRKILTIEDPVEYELPGVAQIPVKPGAEFTCGRGTARDFAAGTRTVVMVGGKFVDSENGRDCDSRCAKRRTQVFRTLQRNDSDRARSTRLNCIGGGKAF